MPCPASPTPTAPPGCRRHRRPVRAVQPRSADRPANRRHFELALASEIDRVARAGEPALVLMIDIDHFKRVNDGTATRAGDGVLQRGRRRAARQRAADGHRGALRRRGVRDHPAELPAVVRADGRRARPPPHRAHADRRSSRPGRSAVTVSIGGAFAPQWVRSTPRAVDRARRPAALPGQGEGRNRACLEQPPVSHVSAEEKGLLFGTFAVPGSPMTAPRRPACKPAAASSP